MATLPQRDSSNLGLHDSGSYHSQEKGDGVGRWYFLRKEIEENSPSRRDGIDLKKETFLRKSYCTFLQDLGMKLKVPQVTIATAIIFCHRFYLRQSHAKNDRRTISTACMFLAGKVEDTPRPLKDVIIVSYEIIYKKDSSAVQRIKQKEVYEQQKELVLLAERVVLATLSFDLNVLHPYKPLVDAIKRFNVAKHALAQVAWNFVNDGLRTSLCLQFKPDHIAAGAIFLAAKFLKVKLPFDGEKIWWLEFDVTPRQLEEVSNQMLELYEQNRVPPASQGSEIVDGGATTSSRISSSKLPIEHRVGNANGNSSHSGGGASKAGPSRSTAAATLSHPVVDHGDNRGSGDPTRSSHSNSDDHREKGSQSFEDDRERNVVGGKRVREDENSTGKEKQFSNGNLDHLKGTTTTTTMTQSPAQGMIMIDEDKLKELREKRKKKSRVDMASLKKDSMDEFDPIVKELEEGVELAAAQSGKKIEEKRRRVGWDEEANGEDDHHHGPKSRGSTDAENVEEGEVSGFD